MEARYKIGDIVLFEITTRRWMILQKAQGEITWITKHLGDGEWLYILDKRLPIRESAIIGKVK